LHQAIEAKEGVQVQRESKTLATITFQNYFRLYKKLAGMTGTAKTEEEEFESIYRLRVVTVPTHRPMIRTDRADSVYATATAKFKAVAKIAKERHAKGQPVLIGTTSIEKSEVMSALLTQDAIPHQVLNAKHHEKEAEIVAQAGQRGTVTIATNMAGRGTDIKLGDGVSELGGLCILGTERHEARRIDNQLRGRAGRQGDPGESMFFVSMEDELMRLFGGDRLKSMMQRLRVPEDVPLENTMVSRSIESAQKKVEGRNFDIRRHVLQYDDVMNRHREIIYKRRQKILDKLASTAEEQKEGPEAWALHADVLQSFQHEAAHLATTHASNIDPDEWNWEGLREGMRALHPSILAELDRADRSELRIAEEFPDRLATLITEFYEAKCAAAEPSTVLRAERIVTLRSIDTHWMTHIDDMSHLREQVSFAGYAQRDPLIEYQDQGFRRFQQLLATIEGTIVRTLLQADFNEFASRAILDQAEEELEGIQTNADAIEQGLSQTGVDNSRATVEGMDLLAARQPRGPRAASQAQPIQAAKVGRNDPCPCGSGKKYKKCHGKQE
jgi:preprotein translocase subunit SecA